MSKFDLNNITSARIVEAIQQDDSDIAELDNLNLWLFIDKESWKKIFVNYPQFSDRYKEAYLFGIEGWCGLLSQQHALLETAKNYKVGWGAIIALHPEFTSECPCLNNFSKQNWSEIISLFSNISFSVA